MNGPQKRMGKSDVDYFSNDDMKTVLMDDIMLLDLFIIKAVHEKVDPGGLSDNWCQYQDNLNL